MLHAYFCQNDVIIIFLIWSAEVLRSCIIFLRLITAMKRLDASFYVDMLYNQKCKSIKLWSYNIILLLKNSTRMYVSFN